MNTQRRTSTAAPHWPRRAAELMGFAPPPARPTLLAQYRIAQLDRQIKRQQELDAQRRRELRRPLGVVAALAIAALVACAPASAHTYMVNPFRAPMHRLQRIVDRARCKTPLTTVMVWPLESLPGTGPNTGAVDFEGQRPFLIAEPARPTPEVLFHELGHVLDDGWLTPAQRLAFASGGQPPPPGSRPIGEWLLPDGSDGVSDNFAQSYAVACIYGAHPSRSIIRELAGVSVAQWPAEYAIVASVAAASQAGNPQPAHPF